MYSAVTEMKQKVLSTWEMIQLTEIKRERGIGIEAFCHCVQKSIP